MCPLVSAFSRSFSQTERARPSCPVQPLAYHHLFFSFQWTSCVAAGQRRVPSILARCRTLHFCIFACSLALPVCKDQKQFYRDRVEIAEQKRPLPSRSPVRAEVRVPNAAGMFRTRALKSSHATGLLLCQKEPAFSFYAANAMPIPSLTAGIQFNRARLRVHATQNHWLPRNLRHRRRRKPSATRTVG
jgi:hypothetical protein